MKMVVKSKYRSIVAGWRFKQQLVVYRCRKKMGCIKYKIGLATFTPEVHKFCSLKPEGDKLLYGVVNRNGA